MVLEFEHKRSHGHNWASLLPDLIPSLFRLASPVLFLPYFAELMEMEFKHRCRQLPDVGCI